MHIPKHLTDSAYKVSGQETNACKTLNIAQEIAFESGPKMCENFVHLKTDSSTSFCEVLMMRTKELISSHFLNRVLRLYITIIKHLLKDTQHKIRKKLHNYIIIEGDENIFLFLRF